MTKISSQILDLIKSDQSTQHEAGLLALNGWVEANKDITTLDLSFNDLGEHAVGVCEHLSKLPNLTTLDLSGNALGGHAVSVCQSFLKPIAAITLSLIDNELSEDIQTQCRQVAQENLNLRKKT